MNDFGDNSAYLRGASTLRHWEFQWSEVKQFWGLTYRGKGSSSICSMKKHHELFPTEAAPRAA